ncbi:MAG: cytosine permease [Desulfurococcales archaeon]|nr:cytosine permease [Desulfurococcales archaeon]
MGSGLEARRLGPVGFALLMFSMTACLPLFFLGPMAYSSGLSLGQALVGALVGNGLVGAAMVVNGLPGVRERMDFNSQARMAFGRYYRIPVLLRGVVGGLWYGVEAYNGALALALIALALAGSPTDGIMERATLLVPLFLALYVATATTVFAKGIEAVGRAASVVGPLLFLYFLALLAQTPRSSGVELPGGTGWLDDAFLTYLAVQTGWWLTVAINMSDLSRTARSPGAVAAGVFLGMVGGQILGTYTGYMLAATSGALLPQELIVRSGVGLPLTLLGLAFAFLAPWTTDLSANLPALESLLRSLRLGSRRNAAIAAGLLGLVLAPWYAMDKAQDIVGYVASFAADYGILLGPVLGSMIPSALGYRRSPRRLLAAIMLGIVAAYIHAVLAGAVQHLELSTLSIPFPPPVALYTGTIVSLITAMIPGTKR